MITYAQLATGELIGQNAEATVARIARTESLLMFEICARIRIKLSGALVLETCSEKINGLEQKWTELRLERLVLVICTNHCAQKRTSGFGDHPAPFGLSLLFEPFKRSILSLMKSKSQC